MKIYSIFSAYKKKRIFYFQLTDTKNDEFHQNLGSSVWLAKNTNLPESSILLISISSMLLSYEFSSEFQHTKYNYAQTLFYNRHPSSYKTPIMHRKFSKLVIPSQCSMYNSMYNLTEKTFLYWDSPPLGPYTGNFEFDRKNSCIGISGDIIKDTPSLKDTPPSKVNIFERPKNLLRKTNTNEII